MGRESSWAGAGMISPASLAHARSAYDRLRAVSFKRIAELSDLLKAETGVDVGLRRTGGIQLFDEGDIEGPRLRDDFTNEGVEAALVSGPALAELEPKLAERGKLGVWVPSMSQVRNPWLLRGLLEGCRARGVALHPHCSVVGIESASTTTGVRLSNGALMLARQVVIAAGAWSGGIMARLGVTLPVFPIRGQILLLRTTNRPVQRIIEVGKRYLVPRDDGLILVGSTEEDVGFHKAVTEEGLGGLHRFAVELFPALANAPVEASWSGLRPGTRFETPVIGRAPGWENLWLATGHFRRGIQLAAGTAVLLADWLTGRASFAEPKDFSLESRL
jgi:glycine oxidase